QSAHPRAEVLAGGETTVVLRGQSMSPVHPAHASSEEMRDRFDLLASGAKEYAIVLIGLDGRLICWNVGAERVFGYQSPEIIRQHFSRFYSPEDVLTGVPEQELKTALADGHVE